MNEITSDNRIPYESRITSADRMMFLDSTRRAKSTRTWTGVFALVTNASLAIRTSIIGGALRARAACSRVAAHTVRTEAHRLALGGDSADSLVAARVGVARAGRLQVTGSVWITDKARAAVAQLTVTRDVTISVLTARTRLAHCLYWFYKEMIINQCLLQEYILFLIT